MTKKNNILPVKNFSPNAQPLISQPNLNELQIKSYDWFTKKGIKELFQEISPIHDHTGKELELYFDDYYFDEPKFDEKTARYKDTTYEAAFKVKLRLVNKRTKKEEVQEVYLGDFPQMTERGTFIINGVELSLIHI